MSIKIISGHSCEVFSCQHLRAIPIDYSSVGIGYIQNDLNTTADGLGLNSLSLDTEENAAYALDNLEYALIKAAAIMSRFEIAQSKIRSSIDDLENPDLSFIFDRGDIENTDEASVLLGQIKQFLIDNADDSITAQSMPIPQALALLE